MSNNNIKLIIGESPYPGRKTYKKLELDNYLGVDDKQTCVAFVPIDENDNEKIYWCEAFKKVIRLLYGEGSELKIEEKNEMLSKLKKDNVYLINLYNELNSDNKIDRESINIDIIEKFILNNSDKNIDVLLVGREARLKFKNKEYEKAKLHKIIHPCARGAHYNDMKASWIEYNFESDGKYNSSYKIKKIFRINKRED